MKINQKERWKDIKNYEGLYQISNFGNVRSISRIIKKDNHNYKLKGKILKPFIARGYYQVILYKNNIKQHFNIHRLVAQAFIPKIKNKQQVNHINGIKTDNRAENLEWCTQSENQLHAYKMGLQKPISGGKNVLSKPVIQYNKEGKELNKYESIMDAERTTGLYHGNISKCCKNKEYKSCGGYIWKYEDIVEDNIQHIVTIQEV